MNRRDMIVTSGLGIAGFAVGTGFAAPACGVSKEKAVRVTGFVIEIAKEAVPLLDLLNAHDLAITVDAKVIPALEKLKSVLASADIPASQSTLATVRNALSTVGNALLNLPDTPRRTTIVGILASINVMLLTVEAFVESETPQTAPATVGLESTVSSTTKSAQMLKVFQATRQ
jgi:hypothetical protein